MKIPSFTNRWRKASEADNKRKTKQQSVYLIVEYKRTRIIGIRGVYTNHQAAKKRRNEFIKNSPNRRAVCFDYYKPSFFERYFYNKPYYTIERMDLLEEPIVWPHPDCPPVYQQSSNCGETYRLSGGMKQKLGLAEK